MNKNLSTHMKRKGNWQYWQGNQYMISHREYFLKKKNENVPGILQEEMGLMVFTSHG